MCWELWSETQLRIVNKSNSKFVTKGCGERVSVVAEEEGDSHLPVASHSGLGWGATFWGSDDAPTDSANGQGLMSAVYIIACFTSFLLHVYCWCIEVSFY